ncbi:hypothetical protein V2J09_001196 [Rumex salicifolius]
MKRPSPPPNPNLPSPSTSSSSSSCVLDDHPSSDQPLKQSTKTRAKRARKRVVPQQCHQKEKQISSTTTTNSDANNTNTTNSSRRSSVYRGVTRHRWTGRFEAHLWDKSSYNSIQNKKGKQGAYDCEDDAARTYDLAALKYWGPETILNFPSESYIKELEEMQNVSKNEYLASLRRRSSGFSRGVSKYRGVAKHHHNGRWEARIGRVFGNKYLYLGTFSSQEEAAKAYDLAAIQYRGRNAVTNFDINNYIPKDELQQDENPTTLVESTQDVVIQPDEEPSQGHEQEQSHQPPPIVDSFDESDLANVFNESPVLVMDGPSSEPHEDDPWSFNLQDDDGGGYDPMLVPHILNEEEDGSLLDLLDPKAFEDDINSIFDGYLDGMDNGGCQLMNEEEKMIVDKTSFDSSSPSSFSTSGWSPAV